MSWHFSPNSDKSHSNFSPNSNMSHSITSTMTWHHQNARGFFVERGACKNRRYCCWNCDDIQTAARFEPPIFWDPPNIISISCHTYPSSLEHPSDNNLTLHYEYYTWRQSLLLTWVEEDTVEAVQEEEEDVAEEEEEEEEAVVRQVAAAAADGKSS